LKARVVMVCWFCVMVGALHGCDVGGSSGSALFRDGFDIGWCCKGARAGVKPPDQVLVVRLRDPKVGAIMSFQSGSVGVRIDKGVLMAKPGEIFVVDQRGELPRIRLDVDADTRLDFLETCRRQRAVRPALDMLFERTKDDRLRAYVARTVP